MILPSLSHSQGKVGVSTDAGNNTCSYFHWLESGCFLHVHNCTVYHTDTQCTCNYSSFINCM